MILRAYTPADLPEMARLFYETVHTVNARDYSEAQLNAWASGTVDEERWNRSYLSTRTLIAEESGRIIGFGNMDDTGYLDMLYVHKDFQNQGVATAICDDLESRSAAKSFTTHASITAKPFFERRGYAAVKRQQVECRGVKMTNFVMTKDI